MLFVFGTATLTNLILMGNAYGNANGFAAMVYLLLVMVFGSATLITAEKQGMFL